MIKKTVSEDKANLIALMAYSFLLLFFCSKMSPLYPINEWSDINLYFTIGKAIFNDKVLYADIFDHKGPLIFFIYGIGGLISKDSFIGVYLIESLAWALMTAAAYLAARLYTKPITAFIVALVFPLLMLSHSSQGGSAEEFIAVCQAISLYLFIRYFKEDKTERHKPSHMLLHGALFGIALFMKINLIVFWVFPLAAIFIDSILKKRYRNLIENLVALIIGFGIIAIPIIQYFVIHNSFSQAWDIYIVLNKSYAKLGGIIDILKNLILRFYLCLRFDNYEFVIALLGAFYFPIKYMSNKIGQIGLILSFIALYTMIFMSPNYVYYYSVPYYIYCISGCIVIAKWIEKFIAIPAKWYVYIISFILALGLGIKAKNFFYLPKDIILRQTEPDNLLYRFSHVIEQEKQPTLMNLGLDDAAAIFTLLNIKPNVKYPISPNLPYQIYPDMRYMQTKYIENKETQFIVLSEVSFNYEYFKYLPSLNQNYDLIETYKRTDSPAYYLYKRKD